MTVRRNHLYETSGRPLQRIVLLGLVMLSICARPVVAQDEPQFDHPLFTSPVREALDSPVDVHHLRIQITIDPRAHRLSGRLVADLSSVDSLQEFLDIPAAGLTINRIQIATPGSEQDRDVDWIQRTDTVSIRNPGTVSPDYVVIVDYEVTRGIATSPLGSEDGDWLRVWTDFNRDVPSWIPLPLSTADWLTAELRLSVPDSWASYLPGTHVVLLETGETRTAVSLLSKPGSVQRLGFAAIADAQAAVEDERLTSTSSESVPLDEARISIARMERFFGERLGTVPPDSSRILLFDGPAEPSASGAGLWIAPNVLLPDGLHSPDDDFILASAFARNWTSTNIPLAGWADVWMHDAIPTIMALLYVRDRHGEVAYTHNIWNLRQEYLDESRSYQRPLVWDRWMNPEEMRDAHARGKGAWIFHMLAKRFGEDAIWTALAKLGESGTQQPASTEELRAALEEACRTDLNLFFDQWVYAAGHPILETAFNVSQDQESMQLRIEQVQDGFLIPAAFGLDLEVESSSLVGIDTATIHIEDQASTTTVPISLRPQYVLLDPDGHHLFEYANSVDASTRVSSLRREGSLTARYIASRFLTETEVNASMLIGLRPVFEQRLSPYVDRNLVGVIARMAPSTSALRVVLSVATDSTARIKADAVEQLGTFQGSTEARRTALQEANSSKDPLVLASAVRALVRLDSTLAWRVLQSALVTDSPGNIVRLTAVDLVNGAPVDDDEKISTLSDLLSESTDVRLQDALVEALSAWWQNEAVRSQLLSRWATAPTTQRRVVSRHISPDDLSDEVRDEVERWAYSEPDSIVRSYLKRALDSSIQ